MILKKLTYLLVMCALTCLSGSAFSQSDDPCNAPSLNIGVNCNYKTGQITQAATATTGMPVPACGNYNGYDVWYKFTVPGSGNIVLNTNNTASGPADLAMALYSATSCNGVFTQIACDDDGSQNGLMPMITAQGLAPGSVAYVRIWENGGNEFGSFEICLTELQTEKACTGGSNNNCSSADPFCTGNSYTYCNTTDVSSMGSYDCLGSTPNPMWMYLQVATSGNIDITINQYNNSNVGIDVDFALYGPFTNLSTACSTIDPYTATVDCSYSTAYTEVANITGAVAGQYYMLLITNYNNGSGYITFSQTGGAGATNCNIVAPCSIATLTATPTCSGSTYSVAGSMTFTGAPTTGTLTVSSSCGGSQTFSAPFSSPLSYNLTGLTPNGAACTVTAVFSANTACTKTATYTAPALPTINAGADQTICTGSSATLTGSGGSTYSWSTGSTGSSITVSPTATTTYTLTGTSAAGCTNTDQVIVNVNALPVVNAGADQTICTGSSASLTASGASTYSWSPSTGLSATSGASVTASPTATTTYTVTGTSAAGCVATDQVIVTVNAVATVNANVDQTVCAGGTVTLAGSYGGSATSATWTAGSGTFSNASSLTSTYTPSITSGTVTLTLTTNDPTGPCPSVTDQLIITVNPLPTVNAGADVAICAGSSTTLTASGASTYSWSPSTGLSSTSTASVTASPTATTTYTVTGTTSGCTSSDQVIVTVNPLPTINAGADVAICTGASTTLTASGGSTYSWSPSTGLSATSGTSVTASPTSTTTYTVTGTSAAGCVSTDQVVVTVNALPTVNAGVDQTVCAGTSVTLSGSGASTYSWNNGVTNGTAFTPSVGTVTYTVTGTSSAGCVNTDQVIVTVNAIPVVSVNSASVCTGNSATLTASGATTYTWTPSTGLSATTGASVTATPSATTTYTVSGTTSGCTSSATATVTVMANAPINAGADAAICSGASTTLTATGGVSYSWNNSLGSGNNISISPTSTTTYTVTGTDANGCLGTDAVTITVNPLPTVNAGSDQTVCQGTSVTLSGSGASTYSWNNGVSNGVAFTPVVGTITYTVTGTTTAGCTGTDQVVVTVNALPVVNAGADQTVCQGTSVTLTATGATSYTWSGGISNGVAFTPTATTTYTVTGTNANGCVSTDQVVVTVNALPAVNAGTDQTVCQGTSVTLSGTGASTYSWNNSVTNGVAFTPVVGTATYTVTGTDVNGCINTDQVVVTVNALPTVNAGTDQTVCQGTSVTLSGSGAVTYSWNNGVSNGTSFTPAVGTTTYTVTGTDANGCVNTDQVTVNVNALPTVNAGTDQTVCQGTSVSLSGSGAVSYSWNNSVSNGVSFTPAVGTITYTVTGTDANGCINTDQVVVTVNALPTVNAGTDQTVCDGTSVTLSGSGATTYSWNNGVSNGVAFTPAVGTITYNVTGTDANGCINTDQVAVTVNPNPVPVINGPTNYCAGYYATLSTSVAYTTYNWSTGSTASSVNVTTADNSITVTVSNSYGCTATSAAFTVTEDLIITSNSTIEICQGQSAVIHGVTQTTAGTYSQTYSTASGCDSLSNITLVVHALPTVNAGIDQAVCTGVSTTLTASGANFYSWDNGITNAVPFTQAIGSITYTVTGTDVNGCENTDQATVTVNPLPTVSAGTDFALCIGASATLSGSGSATVYTWNNGVSDGVSFSPTVTNTYTVTGTDGNGCVNSDQVTVTVNPLPTVNAGADVTICTGSSTTLSVSGSANTLNWSPSTGLSSSTSNPVTANPTVTTTYTVSGTDANGCVNSDQVIVTVNSLPAVNAGSDAVICYGTSTSLTGSGASIYNWSPTTGLSASSGSPVTASPVSSTTYTLTGTDVNGCVNTDQVLVTVNTLPIVNAGTDQTVCYGTSVTLSGSGATTYSWNNAVTNGVAFVPATTATYTVTGTDGNGCTNTDQVLVTVNALPVVNAGADQTICIGVSVTLTGSGITGSATYNWDQGITNNTAFYPTSTLTYTVTGTNANGCTDDDQVVVTVNPLPVVVASSDVAICNGFSTSLTASGASVYTWTPVTGLNTTSGTPVTASPANTTTYTVSGTDANGCVNSDQVTITVNHPAQVYAGSDQVICIGQSVILSGSGMTGANYTWDNSVQNNVAFYPNSTVTYTLTGTDPNGCISTDQVNVTVNPLPVVYAGNDLEICENQSIVLSASGALTYSWSNGVANNGTFIPPVGSSVYTVTGTDGNGCVNTDQMLVLVNALPSVNFSADTLYGCVPLQVHFSNLTPATATAYWTLGNGTTSTETSTVIATYPNGGCYPVSLTITDTNGCVNALTYQDMICTEEYPIATFNYYPDPVTTINTTIEFNNTSVGAVNYLWTFGDGEASSSSQEDPVFTYPEEAAYYNVWLYASTSFGCTDSVKQLIQIIEETIFYVPNTFTPDGDMYNQVFKPVFTSGFDPFNYSLLIFDRWGEIIFESHDTEIGWDGSYGSKNEVDMVQDGVYTWKITYKKTSNDEHKTVVGHVTLIR